MKSSFRLFVTDLGVILLLAGVVYLLKMISHQWKEPLQLVSSINLSYRYLPYYALLSLLRGFFAYFFSFIFTLGYGYVAARRPKADRFMIPLLDVLQSIPVLGFLPSAVLALVALFPKTNFGLELASILMIFTGQVWNMTFSFYQSLKTIPPELMEASQIYQFNGWQRFLRVELPASAVSLTWNSMMAMAGGWFFLMVCEAFTLGSQDFRLPGLGAYMSVAVAQGQTGAIIAGIITMMLTILCVNAFIWRPLILWAQKFRIEEGSPSRYRKSRIYGWLNRSRLLNWFYEKLTRPLQAWLTSTARMTASAQETPQKKQRTSPWIRRGLAIVGWMFLSFVLLWSAWHLFLLLESLPLMSWAGIILGAFLTFLRVLFSVILGSLWTIPLGVWIGGSIRRTNFLQPIVQFAASFPAPMLYPLILMFSMKLSIPFSITSIVLMTLGTQWYILFNVIAGASSVPFEFREAARMYQFTLWQRWKNVWLPAIFPFLLTGWVTAAGGAWNASILSEYMNLGSQTMATFGLGALISKAATQAQYDLLAAGVITMALVVVLLNRLFWKPLYRLSETRFAR